METSKANKRSYHPMIVLSECVQYDILPAFGITATMVRDAFIASLPVLSKDMNDSDIIRVSSLAKLYSKNSGANNLPEDKLLVKFFDMLSDDPNTKDLKGSYGDLIKAITFGLGEENER